MRISSLLALCVSAASLRAQDSTLTVIRTTPGDTASPGNIVTVTFDRPVAGRLDATIEASKIFQLHPAVRGKASWRDPVTIRFIPDEPFTPGETFTVTIDTTFHALDGAKLKRPYRFVFRVPGPRLLARANDGGDMYGTQTLPRDGRFKLLFSSPVDLDRFSKGTRVALSTCESAGPVTIPYRAVRQRPVDKSDMEWMRFPGIWTRDTIADRFRRVVELEPVSPLPPGCSGVVVLPTTAEDARYGPVESYRIQTRPRFRLNPIACKTDSWIDHRDEKGSCLRNGIVVSFTAPVARSELEKMLRIQPAVPLRFEWNAPIGSSWSLLVRLAPRTRYTITVDTALRDVDGRPLEGSRTVEVTTGDFQPEIATATGVILLPKNGDRSLLIRHINVSAVRVISVRIPARHRVDLMTLHSSGIADKVAKLGLKAETTFVDVRGQLNEKASTNLHLPANAAPLPGEVAAIRLEVARTVAKPPPLPNAREDQPRRPLPFSLVQITDLAVHAKMSGTRNVVLVTSLSDGRPRAGVTIRQLSSEKGTTGGGVTGSDGVVVLAVGDRLSESGPERKEWSGGAQLIEASLGNDRVLTSPVGGWSDYGNWLAPSSLGAYSGSSPPFIAYLFSDRGIYRPGEMLYLKGVLRKGALNELTAAQGWSLRLTVKRQHMDWGGNGMEEVVVRDASLKTDEFGTVSDSCRLPASAEPGEYVAALEMRIRRQRNVVATVPVIIADYRAPEFLVGLRSDSVQRRGSDTARIIVSARYLFGAPMGHAEVSSASAFRVVSSRPRIPGAEGWTVGEDDMTREGARPRDSTRLASTLDSTGQAILAVPLRGLEAHQAAALDVHVAVFDLNRQYVSSSLRVDIPARAHDVYVLARKKDQGWYWRTGDRAAIEVKTVRPDGSALRGVPVIASVYRREWSWDHWGEHSLTSDSLIRVDTLQTTESPITYTFTPPLDGTYHVRFAAHFSSDTSTTALAGYAFSGRYAWNGKNPYRLQLIASKTELSVGQQTEIAFDSPFDDTEAWITFERENVIESRRMVAKRGLNVLPVTITGAHIPNIFVSVLLLRPAGQESPTRDSGSMLLRAGYVELVVKTDPKRLAIDIRPDVLTAEPGKETTVRVRVRDARGDPAEAQVTLWAVDEGVLALTGYRQPDLVDSIFRRRGVGSSLFSTLASTFPDNDVRRIEVGHTVAMLASAALMTSTASGSIFPFTPPQTRSKFRSTAFFFGAIKTDRRGEAVVSARLPDNITTFRVMAIALDKDDRFGTGDTPLLVTRPLVARPSLPRFIRPGDTLFAGAVINARDARRRDVEVGMASEGITLKGSDRQRVTLQQGRGVEARFDLVGPSREARRDTAIVRINATDGTNGDAVETRLAIQPDFHRRVHTRFGTVQDSAVVEIELPPHVDPMRSTVSVRVGTTPIAPILAAYERLRVYPYDCTEQLTSTGRALIAAWRGTRNSGNVLGRDPRSRLQTIVDTISRRQHSNGAFGYWNASSWTDDWLSAYVGLFLLEAREADVRVDDQVIARLIGYAKKVASLPLDTGGMNRHEQREKRLALSRRVALVDFLRRAGSANKEGEDALLRIAPRMTWEDRLRLAEALATRSDVRSQILQIVDAAWAATKPAGRRVDLPDSAYAERCFPSGVAPASQLLIATLALRPEHPMLGGLIETVLQHGRAQGSWVWSTQDFASAILAMTATANDDDGDRDIRLTSNGKVLFSGRIGQSDSTNAMTLSNLLVPSSNGRSSFRVRVDTRDGGMVYFAVSVAEVPLTPPVTPDIQGIAVERWYERLDNGSPVTSVNEGDVVRVRLRITVPTNRQFVAVEDPLPAGLEPIDLRLRTSATLAPLFTPQPEYDRLRSGENRDFWLGEWSYGHWDNGWWSPWEHKAMYDDKVVYFARMLWAGTYSVTYVARATTAGTFVRPPAHAEEMYNPGLQGRSDGGRFEIKRK
jgi:alpha-2-macroglobulin